MLAIQDRAGVAYIRERLCITAGDGPAASVIRMLALV